jgi:Mg/Co/Ni transporter MgtE
MRTTKEMVESLPKDHRQDGTLMVKANDVIALIEARDGEVRESFINELKDKLGRYTVKARESKRMADLSTEQFLSLLDYKPNE